MASLNLIQIIGNVGRDPEVSYMASGKAVAVVSIATTEKWTDKQTGEKKESTEWHRVVFYGGQAETIARYVTKGSTLYVQGKNKTSQYEKDGITRYSTSIQAHLFQFLDGKERNITQNDIQQNQFVPNAFSQQQKPQQQQQQGQQQQNSFTQNQSSGNDDIPF